jgi:hypothetical protein
MWLKERFAKLLGSSPKKVLSDMYALSQTSLITTVFAPHWLGINNI